MPVQYKPDWFLETCETLLETSLADISYYIRSVAWLNRFISFSYEKSVHARPLELDLEPDDRVH